MRPRGFTILVLIGALLGFVFSAVSTYDFVAHLDRQVHGIHCSFLPGLEAADASGATGCHTTMMSPYSSVLRQSLWGGIPISLPAMAVFAFIAFWAISLVVSRRQDDLRATGFLLAATLLPVGASLVMGILSVTKLEAVCKLCVGIYVASALVFVGAFGLFWTRSRARIPADATVPGAADTRVDPPRPMSSGGLALAFVLGLLFVLTPLAVYAAAVPNYASYVAACGRLKRPEAPADVLVSIGPQGAGTPAIEVLDPLCPACRAFEGRLAASGLADEISRKALLFPLDDTCNWMVSTSVHPGACAVSEAMLCAGDQAEAVLAWAFEHQEEIRTEAARDQGAAARMVGRQFPSVAACVGKATVRNRLNRSLRWAVANELPVLTPQLYVGDVKLCDEDTDLGMDYALARLVERIRAGGGRGQ